jgi:hypothetical protein
MFYEFESVGQCPTALEVVKYFRVTHASNVEISCVPFQVFAVFRTAFRDKAAVATCYYHGGWHTLSP